MVNNPEYNLLSSGASNVSSTDSDPSRAESSIPMHSGEDSDHEYYNDMLLGSDKAHEMIPLNRPQHYFIRNETTV